MIEIKSKAFKNIYDPYLVETDFGSTSEVEFIIHNTSNTFRSKVVVFFEKSETLGSLDNPGTFEPYIDYYDLLRMGNEKILNQSSFGCLVVEFEGVSHIFSKNIGSKKSNGINLGSFDIDERKTIKIKIEAPSASASRRLFINMVAE